MNIAFVSTGSPQFDDYPDPNHGTSVQIWKLANEFVGRGHDVSIYYGTVDEREDWTTENGIRMSGITKPSVDDFINGLFTKLVFSKRVAEVLRERSPDVVYLRERTTAVFPVRLPIPTVYTVISPDACDYFFKFSLSHHPGNLLLFPYKRTIEEYVCRRADATIVMNEGMRDYFQAKGIDTVHTVSIAIEEARFRERPSSNRQNRLLFVGRFDYNKRPGWLLEAFAKCDADRETELHFVGSGPEGDALRERVKELGMGASVTFHGWVEREQVLELMADSSGLVLPSRYENSPNVVLEAMASGCPVVASDTRGAKSMINHGETGLLFDRGDLSDLEATLNRLLQNKGLRNRLSENGRAYALQKHAVGRIADEYLAVYEGIT